MCVGAEGVVCVCVGGGGGGRGEGQKFDCSQTFTSREIFSIVGPGE